MENKALHETIDVLRRLSQDRKTLQLNNIKGVKEYNMVNDPILGNHPPPTYLMYAPLKVNPPIFSNQGSPKNDFNQFKIDFWTQESDFA